MIPLPLNKPIVGLIRHAAREPIQSGDFGNDVNLTQHGLAASRALAKNLPLRLKKIYSSPIKRCLQTSELLAAVADDNKIETLTLLGDPGIFITNPSEVESIFIQHKTIDIVKHLLSDALNLPGFCYSTLQATNNLIQDMLSKATAPGIYLFVTHDSILSPVLGCIFRDITIEKLWPNYLECLFIWQSALSHCIVYRDLFKSLELSY